MSDIIIDDTELDVRESTLMTENAVLRDQLLRALADGENTRRQAERTASDARQYAVLEFAREILGVDDNLQRAIAAAERQQHRPNEDASLIEGVRATQRMLESVFERFGVRKISALAARFDPNLHEAVMEVDDASSPSGTVARVFEDGYTLHDRLVRPARVSIVRRRSNVSNVSDVEASGYSPQNESPNYRR